MTISPNPHSPYATADPNTRHLIPSLLGALPKPGKLALTACDRMAVVPTEPLDDATDALRQGRHDQLPAGLCADCIGAASGELTPTPLPATTCEDCGNRSTQGQYCTHCRLDLHEDWWDTHNEETR